MVKKRAQSRRSAEVPGRIGWIRQSKKDALPVAPLFGEPLKGFKLDFGKIEKAAWHQFDEKIQSRIYVYVDTFLSVCHAFQLDEKKARAEYRHLAHVITRYSASSASRYFAKLGRSGEPEKLAVVERFRGLFPTTDTPWLRRFAPLIRLMRLYPRRPGRQTDYFSGFIEFLDLCFPDGDCYYNRELERKLGSFVDFVCEIVRQMKPYLRDSNFGFLPKGIQIMQDGISDKDQEIIGARCYKVRDRLKRRTTKPGRRS
ncbi:MAG: hypothetical protein ABSF77_15700 [Spirochaetia bacterium]